MARERDSSSAQGDGLRDGLKHNPFAALRPGGSATPPKPASDADSTPHERTPDDARGDERSTPRAADSARKDGPRVADSTRNATPRAADSARGAKPHADAKGGAGRLVVRRERKGHGGKAVTIAAGPGLAGHDVAALARDAARALGAGARAEDGALVVQGEQTERLVAWLVGRGFGPVSRGN